MHRSKKSFSAVDASWISLQGFITSQSFYRMFVAFIISPPLIHFLLSFLVENFSSLMDFQQCREWNMCFLSKAHLKTLEVHLKNYESLICLQVEINLLSLNPFPFPSHILHNPYVACLHKIYFYFDLHPNQQAQSIRCFFSFQPENHKRIFRKIFSSSFALFSYPAKR